MHDGLGLIPTLNQVSWADFQVKDSPDPAGKHVIDILNGKPTVIWYISSRANSIKRQQAASKIATVNPVEAVGQVTGDGLLPDRIRVNSRLLLLIFSRFHGLSDIFGGANSVVFMRPFKMFIHFQQELRDWLETLVKKHGQQAQATQDTIHDSESQGRRTPLADLLKAPVASHSPTEGASEPLEPHNLPKGSEESDTDWMKEEIYHFQNAIESELALQHMRPLMDFMDRFILPRQSYLESTRCSKVTFHDMWLLFKPGDEVIETDGYQAYRIVHIETSLHRAVAPWEVWNEQPILRPRSPGSDMDGPPPPPPPPWGHAGDNRPFKLWCVYIDTDGFNLGPVTVAFEIRAFEGEKNVMDLPIYPVRLNTIWPVNLTGGAAVLDAVTTAIRDKLIRRGRDFVERNSIQHAYYAGPCYRSRGRLEGQVVIDNAQIFAMDDNRKRPPLGGGMPVSPEPGPHDAASAACNAECCYRDLVWGDQHYDRRRNVNYAELHPLVDSQGTVSISMTQRPISDVQKDHQQSKIRDADYLIMSDRVFGYVLRTRKWAELDLLWISEAKYNREKPDMQASISDKQMTNTAFDDLVLPPGHKDVILSLVAQHFRDDSQEVDIFQGKGKGLIMLLHGAPGVGKTSTAEGVAEAFRKPLLQITCGDLGFTAEKVEESLARNFELASRWGCVLLLDEADVFLASRKSAESSADLSRNALVAVFLRVLEYYTGILFLTTNRIGDFDEAFASRIHLSLEYPQLSKESTESILALNMRLIKKRFRNTRRTIDIEETEICSKFSKYWEENEEGRLNGRQIRNACQTALALAEFEAQGNSHKDVLKPDATVRLQPMHFNTILKAYLDFADYLNKTYGVTPEQRAKEQKLRAKDRQMKKPKPMHTQTGSAGSHAGGFGGAHLYNQTGQHFAPNQPAYQMSSPPQAYQQPHQMYQGPMPGQQGFHMPGQYAVPSAGYANPGIRADNQHLSVASLEPALGHNEDTRAGHNAQYQAQSTVPGSVLQYPQPQQPNARY
ncbi:hypothetical protein C7974DRAFT_304466 [Boeremia exigua]|uniref:uncharacterized protein n=1 Tax=Boeremia exigua TaxID=749465 RepID=UPI001E8E15C2|nr:uncharacterized protein C7974DRAFT_304466 [Boeremia exigua]KAH6639086.1 hypothetical protein C7974DRAFT_304466 [Boeremia exigua]